MNRLEERLRSLQQRKRKALSVFVTAGFPAPETTVPLVAAIARAGADLVEIGIPFSDPIADGPTIQMSSETALRNGVTLNGCLAMARAIRAETDIPLILMGYVNSLYAFGVPAFLDACCGAGVDGTIIPDLPLEESGDYRSAAGAKNLSTVFLAAPTTPRERLIRLDQISTGFLYCVSMTGVTGERRPPDSQAESFLREVRSVVRRNPLLVGFGISTPEDARHVASFSDGVIVGSAVISVLQHAGGEAIGRAAAFVQSLRTALDS